MTGAAGDGGTADAAAPAGPLARRLARADRVRHHAHLAGQVGRTLPWPSWVPDDVLAAYAATGITEPWEHQVVAADALHSGRSVVIATGTASGKSLAFGMAALAAVHAGGAAPDGRGSTVLYLSPTKALAHDQHRSLEALGLPWLRSTPYDGDTPTEERAWIRAHASYVLTNPDLLHHSLLPGHERWAPFLRRLRMVVVDEAHAYRGVTGAHVALVLRRLLRVCAHYGATPTVALASATVANPADAARRLLGQSVEAVTESTAARPARDVLFWEPPMTAADSRRSALAEAADLLAESVAAGSAALAFVRSRRGAEAAATLAQEALAEVDDDLPARVAAYRGGYLPEERRDLESRLRSGALLGLATTNALELGIDVSGLDAVIVAGWPGTRASLWQQFGRAGRADRPGLGILVARDDPLDTYVVHHPESVLGRPVEAVVFDPANPHVLAPHLCAAAAEIPLTEDDVVARFGEGALAVVASLTADGWLRRRPTGWFWTRPERASDLTDLRGSGGAPVRIVEDGTGRLLGTVDAAAAPATVHPGAVYVHRGVSHVVRMLDLDDRVATVEEQEVDYSTIARSVSDISVLSIHEQVDHDGGLVLSRGEVVVTSQVVSFQRRHITGHSLGEELLDLPTQTLTTTAVWWTLPEDVLVEACGDAGALPGALHAAEHAAIGLLPLFATCDRWDIGGVSTAAHADTGRPSVFVYDGYPGGAGFADRGFAVARDWLGATREVIAECACDHGCPSCVQSPKCGNGNNPLDKPGAIAVLDLVLARLGPPTVPASAI